jgi:hypothetical protein
VLVVILIWREQRSLRWSRIRDALWLRSPRSPHSGRTGGRVWLGVIPLMVAYAAVPFVFPSPPSPEARDFGLFLESDAGQSFMSGNWLWFGLLVVLWVFNTVLGEELLFRGLLLPRMNWRLWARRLGGQRRPVRRLSPARPVGHTRDPARRHADCGLPGETVPERMDRDRGAQRPERGLGNHRPHTCRLKREPGLRQPDDPSFTYPRPA